MPGGLLDSGFTLHVMETAPQWSLWKGGCRPVMCGGWHSRSAWQRSSGSPEEFLREDCSVESSPERQATCRGLAFRAVRKGVWKR